MLASDTRPFAVGAYLPRQFEYKIGDSNSYLQMGGMLRLPRRPPGNASRDQEAVSRHVVASLRRSWFHLSERKSVATGRAELGVLSMF